MNNNPALDRRKGYKKGVDLEESRRRREETTIQIRKAKKDEQRAKRRQQLRQSDNDHNSSFAMANDQFMNTNTTISPFQNTAPSSTSSTTATKLEHLPQMIAGVMGEDPEIQKTCTTQFRRLLSIEKNPPIQEVIDANVVPRFVQFLSRNDSPALQFEAAWALTNIASGTSDNTRVVIDHGAVPIFVQLLSSMNDDVREQAVWALGNIAGDSPPCRDMVLNAGAMEPLLRQLQSNGKLSMMRNATWTLSNFCRGKPQPIFDMVRVALPTLAELICYHDEEVLTDSCWALSYLSDGPNEKIQAVIDAGVCRKLVELLTNPSPAVQTPALRTVGNIVTGNDEQTQFIINNNALPYLLSLLQSPKKGIRKEACWTISNITAGLSEQIQSVIDANIIPPLILLLVGAEFDIRKEAAWAISNATSGGTPEQIKFLVTQGCIRPLCELLSVTDPKIVTIALEALENILKVGDNEAKMTGSTNDMVTYIADADGISKIEDLQHHSEMEIYEKSYKIIETYFDVEDQVEIAGLAPNMDGDQFEFSSGGGGSAMQTNFDFSS